MLVYRGWGTWASVVCGPAVVGIGTGNGRFGLGDDGVLGITVLIKELDAYGMPLGFPGGFKKLLVRMVRWDNALRVRPTSLGIEDWKG